MAMRDYMRTLDDIAKKIPLATNGEALLGLAFVLSGLIVGREGYVQLTFFWRESAALFPFAVTPDLQQRVLVSLPLILTIFIATVSSIAALLTGVLWVFSGLAQAFRSRRSSVDLGPFQDPDLVAESLRRSEPLNWVSPPLTLRFMEYIWSGAGAMTPVAHEMLRRLAWTLVRLLLTVLAIALIVYGLNMIPTIVRNVFRREIELFVPSAGPLYILIGFVFVIDGLIGLSLVPFRQPQLERSVLEFPVRGRGDPHILLALLEEGCRLLTPTGRPETRPVRLEAQEDSRRRGTLVESFATEMRSLGRPAAYFCLLLTVLLLVTGFSRLIHFQRSIAAMPYSEFLSLHLLGYVLDVTFSVGMVLCGLHFAEWAATLFGMRRFQSSVVFCSVTMEPSVHSDGLHHPVRSGPSLGVEEITWKRSRGVDEQFAHWAKQPERVGRFTLEVFWAEVISESAMANSTRHVSSFQRAPSLDDALKRILQLPFHVGFQREASQKLASAARPAGSVRDPIGET